MPPAGQGEAAEDDEIEAHILLNGRNGSGLTRELVGGVWFERASTQSTDLAAARMHVMLTRSKTDDQILLSELLAPPDLGEGIAALGYWRQRRRRLPWYRFSAKREAERMTIRWEQRVGAAVVGQRGAAPGLRMSGGLLLARSRLGRWAHRAQVVLVAAFAIGAVLVAGVALAVVDFLVHLL